ncbi:phospho-N-acetylmuramoyl-pentapeptide-transferase [Acetanaerobacterium elongatum]|uniref:Phospho-N-acetylmuramoyl-pentapeptide-transferase n=1 Tax=Acetanaerobacterium elongatum TaxID=258515 RepID=A0A1G9VHW7_9FIRM|nr:phospho-N-acetylmuramoyl-pentapeptide-transferase [Acetanaerobacterium elongatum]SDM71878.1 Phospho-N-acetylmuramoyl-pentapeptide-transferase [Acetanaerobacterium elongatum]
MSGIATIVAALTAFVVSSLLGKKLIPFLKRLKYGQTINDIGPTWHKNKQGTPTMGGIMFIVGTLAALAVGILVLSFTKPDAFPETARLENIKLLAGCVMALAYGFIGFTDDYIKVVKKRNLGLTASQKTIMQFVVAILYLMTIYLAGDHSTVLVLPFIGQWNLGIFYYPFAALIIYYMVNAVNLTDGIDGLCASVTFVCGIFLMLMCGVLHQDKEGLFAISLAAACIGFLIWNFHPAKVFMGDTGSMFLGGSVVAIAFGINMPAFLALVGIVYVLDALSVVIQVISFKLTKKRIFKMSPIHHHYEMSGWSEVKIVLVFSLVGVVGGALSLWATALV